MAQKSGDEHALFVFFRFCYFWPPSVVNLKENVFEAIPWGSKDLISLEEVDLRKKIWYSLRKKRFDIFLDLCNVPPAHSDSGQINTEIRILVCLSVHSWPKDMSHMRLNGKFGYHIYLDFVTLLLECFRINLNIKTQISTINKTQCICLPLILCFAQSQWEEKLGKKVDNLDATHSIFVFLLSERTSGFSQIIFEIVEIVEVVEVVDGHFRPLSGQLTALWAQKSAPHKPQKYKFKNISSKNHKKYEMNILLSFAKLKCECYCQTLSIIWI